MRYTWLLLMAVVLPGGSGCSGSAADRDAKDPAVYARAIKKDVADFVQAAKKRPKTVKEQAAIFLEKLEAHASHPVGDHKAIYEQLTQKCKELVAAAKSSPGSAEVTKKLNEMAALADKLPG
jgi:hypothetical protein